MGGERSITNPLEKTAPLRTLSEWEDDVKSRYKAGKENENFRSYETEAADSRVREFYRVNHQIQTLEYAKRKRNEYLPLRRCEMGIWEGIELLDTLTDSSDPDTDLSQLEHCLQAAEAMRKDGQPRWMQLTGLIHDLGKVMSAWGEEQWCVVGDTFPTGCKWDDRIVYSEYFSENADRLSPEMQSECGIYSPHCGLDNVVMSWGHDEYMYHVAKPYLPEEALFVIRYHSFYSAHTEGSYRHLMTEKDVKLMDWVRTFQPYDLYSKGHERPDAVTLRPYYDELIAEFFPPKIQW